MNLKASYWYQMRDNKKAVEIYYFVIICVVAAGFIVSGSDGSGRMGGFDFTTVIFLFVVGLCSFKENFGMLMQNSVSRKGIFIGRIYTMLTLAFGMAVMDRIFQIICNLFFQRGEEAFVTDIFSELYTMKISELSAFEKMLSGILLSFCMYIMVLALGYMITLLFYRLGKGGKIAVSVGVPVTFNIIIPMLDIQFFNKRLERMMVEFIDFAFGITAVKPQNLMISSLILFAITTLIIWLLMKKAVVKE